MHGTSILIIISGGIAAYKSLALIRLLKKAGADVRCILTKGGSEFVTPLSVAALSENAVYSDLFSLKDETEIGHIRLAREADLICVAPASANMLAKMAHGMADDLATTCVLVADAPVWIAPAMNPVMWEHCATQANLKALLTRGVRVIDPAAGEMACGETGEGRMAEPDVIFEALRTALSDSPLAGKRALVTAGPTHEPLDPVRFIGNHSSGKQGYAIAEALAHAGADVTLVSGPCALPAPQGVTRVQVQTAVQMLEACAQVTLGDSVDVAVCAAAVCDWTASDPADSKLKKGAGSPAFDLIETPDILHTLSDCDARPKLVVGFAAETDDVLAYARKKRNAKGCDWIIANDVGRADAPVFGADTNTVHLITDTGEDSWPQLSKTEVAARLVCAIADKLG